MIRTLAFIAALIAVSHAFSNPLSSISTSDEFEMLDVQSEFEPSMRADCSKNPPAGKSPCSHRVELKTPRNRAHFTGYPTTRVYVDNGNPFKVSIRERCNGKVRTISVYANKCRQWLTIQPTAPVVCSYRTVSKGWIGVYGCVV